MRVLPIGSAEVLDQVQQAALQEIGELLARIEIMINHGVGAADIALELYHPDLFVVGEGDPTAACGLPNFMPSFKDLIEKVWMPGPIVEYNLHLPAVLTADSATTFIEFHVTTSQNRNEVMIYRALYGWTKTGAGWRIKLEMYGEGRLR